MVNMERERVLVVDDDEGLLHLMELALKKAGYQVTTANDGPIAVDILREQEPFAVMLADLMMPGMNGLELLRRARVMDPHMEVVVITAAGTIESAISALRADGAYDYLLKPLESMDQLSITVERAASYRRLRLEREALQAHMRAEAERLHAVIANTGDAILAADANGALTIVNPAAARLLERDDLVGRNAIDSLRRPFSTFIANWQAIGSRYPATVEYPWFSTVQMVNLTPVIRDGNWEGWVMVIRDITHLKRLDELKAQMLSEAASRIRLPLAQAINALAELDILAAKDESISGIVYRLTRVWRRIEEWVDDLPALIRLDSGINVQLTSLDLKSLLQEIHKDLFENKIRSRNIRFTLEGDAELPQVNADPELLRRLIGGLITRALIRSRSGDEIRLSARGQRGQVWIVVSDDGPAVSETDLPHLFEKSVVRLDSPLESSGLELALAKAIIDRMGGQIWVGGQGPAGSTITVCLAVAS
jgi:two-component system, OmpR family, sensor histidine kinase ResE